MSAGSKKAGSAEYNCSAAASGNELVSFSASEKEELKEKLNCLPPDMMITWLQGFVTAKKMLQGTILYNLGSMTSVKEEILLSHKKPLTSLEGSIEDEINNYESRSLELRFLKNICSPVLTKENIKGEDCASLRVSLFDSCTGKEVKSGPGSSARVEIVVLEGDLDSDEGDSWTRQEFDQRVIGEVEGKNSLLMGNVCLNLINGTGCVPDIYFKSNSRWTKRTRFRLGARLVDKFHKIRVKEAMTNPFDVKDWRKKLNQSHDIPALCDKVWRLHMIGRKGPVNKRLGMEKITTVKDFLDLHFTNAKKLQEIFRQSSKNLENALSHARTCRDKLMYYPSDLEPKTGVVFSVSGEVHGLVLDGEFASSDMLSESEKDFAVNSVTYAFKHWGDVKVIPFEDQKYLARCSSNASPTDNELVTPSDWSEDIKELISDDIPVFNGLFCSSPYQGLEPVILESIQPFMDDIFSSIEAQQNPSQQHGDTAISVAASKAYKTWKMLLFSIGLLLLRKKYSKSYHVDKKPKLYR